MITFKAKTATGEIINSAITPFFFPAGEAHVKQEPQRLVEPVEIAIIQPSPESLHNDLFALAMWNDYLVGGPTKRVLVMPYAPGARADRGGPFGAEIYGEFISNLLLDQIIIFDPHSPVIVEKLNFQQGGEVTAVYPDEFLSLPHIREGWMKGYTGIIAPDKGAVGRSGAVAKSLGLPLYTAEKTRDPSTGQLSGFKMEGLPESTEEKGQYFLIVDDICDGGGTFLGLLEACGRKYGDIDLYVSHGVFSKNAVNNLSEKFESILTSNSYNPTRHMHPENGELVKTDDFGPFVVFDVIRLLLSKIKF